MEFENYPDKNFFEIKSWIKANLWTLYAEMYRNNFCKTTTVISRKRFIKIVKPFGRIGLAYLKVTEIVWQDRLLVNDGHQVVYLKWQAVSLADVIGELNVCLCHFSKN